MSAANDWNQAPLTDLVRYILEKHHEHLRSELPRLHELLRRAVCAEQAPAQMAEVFGGLWDELDAHLHKEEMILSLPSSRWRHSKQPGLPGATCRSGPSPIPLR